MSDIPMSVPKPAQLPRRPIKAPSPPDEPPELRLRFLGFQCYCSKANQSEAHSDRKSKETKRNETVANPIEQNSTLPAHPRGLLDKRQNALRISFC